MSDMPSTDPLVAAQENTQAALRDICAIDQAESAVTSVRQQDLVAQQQTAARRVDVARERLMAAQQGGNSDAIAEAQQLYDQRCGEFERTSEAIIAELGQIVVARAGSVKTLMHHISRSWEAGQAVQQASTGKEDPSAAAFREALNNCLTLVDSLPTPEDDE